MKFPKIGRGDGSKAVWTFSKKTSKFGDTVVPYRYIANTPSLSGFQSMVIVWYLNAVIVGLTLAILLIMIFMAKYKKTLFWSM